MTKLQRAVLKAMKQDIKKAFEQCAINERVTLFKELENWALTTNELKQEQSELFIKALYECDATQEAQMTIALENGLNKIRGLK